MLSAHLPDDYQLFVRGVFTRAAAEVADAVGLLEHRNVRHERQRRVARRRTSEAGVQRP